MFKIILQLHAHKKGTGSSTTAVTPIPSVWEPKRMTVR